VTERPSFIRDAPEPPKISIGERVIANIKSIQKVDGKYGPQYEFQLELDNGYKSKDWITYYPEPNASSKLGQLCTTIWSNLKQINSPEEAMTELKNYGRIYVECTGTRNHESKQYPNLKIITTYLPLKQSPLH
jgi:hypothetical protein